MRSPLEEWIRAELGERFEARLWSEGPEEVVVPDLVVHRSASIVEGEALVAVPTGRRIAHPWTCGSCHGAGCPEFELVGRILL